MCQRSESQPEMSMPRSLAFTAAGRFRQTSGITITSFTTMSFMRTNMAARLTASNSASAALQSRSYSWLRKRVGFLNPHRFDFWAAWPDRNWFMKNCGSGETMPVLYICMSAEKWLRVSVLAGSDEKKTEATTDFSSTSSPALAHACLTMAWFFWRSEFVEVWNTSLIRLPSLPTRTPSAPRLYPASSRSRLALSTLNSHLVFFERNFSGMFRKLAVTWPVGPYSSSATVPRSTSRATAWRNCRSWNNGCLLLMLDRSPSTSVHGSVWLNWMCSMLPVAVLRIVPLLVSEMCLITSHSICMLQAQSNSPVCSTARAADVASPPPLRSTWSKKGRFGT